uniref:Transposable element P transposase-like RNase H C-terminal domain-containing protein n=1 Tax=Amphimedon queenslandica TaxID=400682 RepID=A0A1X7TVH2_AMPQE
MIVAYSFIDLVSFLFTIPGVKSFLSEHISQDPLEKFFGCQRQRGNAHENPTSQEFLKHNGALRVVNLIKMETHKGNTHQHHDTTNVIISRAITKQKKAIRTTSVIFHAIEDTGFNIPSNEALAAKKSAVQLKEWMINNKSRYIIHNNTLAYFFNIWISVAPTSSVIREQVSGRVCTQYQQIQEIA